MLIATFGAAGVVPLAPLEAPGAAAAAPPGSFAVPLAFEPNLGQAAEGAFLLRGPGYNLALGPEAAVFDLASGGQVARVRMTFPGASPAVVVPGARLPGASNYYEGSDPASWLTGVPHYAQVTLRGLWPGVDAVFYTTPDRHIEYDVVLAPGADASRVRFAFAGADLSLDGDGALALDTPHGTLRHRAPVAYQESAGTRVPVESRYDLLADGNVGFVLGPRDPALPIVIDPVLLYSQLIGGTYNASIPNPLGNGQDYADDVAIDTFGAAYLMGTTTSFNFPVKNPEQGLIAGFSDLFILKLDTFGVWQYSTYLGGSQNNTLQASLGYYGNQRTPRGGIDVDLAGNAYVATASHSVDFPITPGAYQPSPRGGWDGVLVKLDASGQLARSTYFGGNGGDFPAGLALDAAGNVHVGGMTTSSNLPVTDGAAQAAPRLGYEGWAATLDPSLSTVLACTYYGGSGHEYVSAFTADPAGNAYIVGPTGSTDLPSRNAAQSSMVANPDGFLVKVAPDAKSFVYSTYFGAWSDDLVNGVAADAAGNAYIVGITQSTGLDIRGAAMQPLNAGGSYDGFLAKYNAVGSLVYSTYLGGSFNDYPWDVAVDGKERAVVTGYTDSTNVTFPLKDAFDSASLGHPYYYEGFVTRIDTKATTSAGALGFSTYFGHYNTNVRAVAVDSPGNIYLAGYAQYSSVPVRNASVLYAAGNRNGDAFAAAFIEQCGAPPTTTASASGLAGSAGWWRSDVLVTLKATSLSCPVPNTYWWLDPPAPQNQGRLVPVSGDGSHTLVYHSQDLLGGRESNKTTVVKIDSTPPVTTPVITGLDGVGCWYRSQVTVTLTVSDANGTHAVSGADKTSYSLDGGPWVQGTTLSISASGVHTLRYNSTDKAGNIEAVKTTSICLDYLAPATDLIRPAEGDAYVLDVEDPLRPGLPMTVAVGTLEATATATDDPGGSGVERVELVVDGVVRAVDHDAPFTFTWEAGAESAGEHEVQAVAYDMAGNSAVEGRLVFTVPTRHTGVLATLDEVVGGAPLAGLEEEPEVAASVRRAAVAARLSLAHGGAPAFPGRDA